MNNIGLNLRKIRIIKGLSQSEVTKMLHKSQPAYAKIENGSTKIDYDLIQEFSKILNVDIDEILKNENGKVYNISNNKIEKQGFIDNYNSDFKEIFEEMIKELKNLHFESLKLLNEKTEETINVLKEEINFLRNQLNKN